MNSIIHQSVFWNALELIYKADRSKHTARIKEVLDELLEWYVNYGSSKEETLEHIRNHFALYEPPTTDCEVDEHVELNIKTGERTLKTTHISVYGRNAVYGWLVEQSKKKTPNGTNIKKTCFRDLVQKGDKDKFMKWLHNRIDGKEGAEVGCVILKAQLGGYLKEIPTKGAYESEFGKLEGNKWNAIHNYLSESNVYALIKANKVVIDLDCI